MPGSDGQFSHNNLGSEGSTGAASRIDPITLTVLWDGLRGLCADIGYALQRTSYSEIVRGAGDCAAAIFDRRGRNIAQGVFSPGMSGPMTFIVEYMLEHIPLESLQPGDAMITNDIYAGAGQLQDAFTVSPVFMDNELIGFIGSSTHLMDVGGASPGSQAVVGTYDNYQEGLRISPVKHYKSGKPVAPVLEMIANNVRFPRKVMGDIRAMINANNYGGDRLTELIQRYGLDTVDTVYSQILRESEVRTREAIGEVPDGTYSNDLYLDDSGPSTPPVHLGVDVNIQGSEAAVDWSRSDSQVSAGMNSARMYTFAYSWFTLKCLLSPDVPLNLGCAAPIRVEAPEGSFMNPRPPAPGGGRAVTIHRHFETISGAFSKVLPERITGASSQWCNTIVGGEDVDGNPYLFWDLLLGGFAARSTKDGAEGLVSVLNARNIPVEVSEVETPVRIESVSLVQDTGGPGRYRGACALRKDIRFLGRNNRATPVTDRHVFAPHGAQGGQEGALALITLDPEGAEVPLHSKGVHLIEQGKVVRFQTSGAGGYGSPFDRDPGAVFQDVLDGYVSKDAAREFYGVVFAEDMSDVDQRATDAARKELRQQLTGFGATAEEGQE